VRKGKTAEHIPVAFPALERSVELKIYVIFTDFAATSRALEAASGLAHDLAARIELLVAKVVPYPLPLESPPVTGDFTENALSNLADRQETDIAVKVHLCRDRDETVRHALGPKSLVVIGRARCWWQANERTLVRRLRQDGHEVVLIGASRVQPAGMGSVSL
jgi:hypothetical protein